MGPRFHRICIYGKDSLLTRYPHSEDVQGELFTEIFPKYITAVNKAVALFSDLHIGIHRNSPVWLDMAEKWTEWFSSELGARGIREVYCLGDFFHAKHPAEKRTILTGRRVANALRDFEVTLIFGNHCHGGHISFENEVREAFDGHPNFRPIAQGTVFSTGDRTIFLAPWGSGIHDIPKCDAVCGHLAISQCKASPYSVFQGGINPWELGGKTTRVFSGHFHPRSENSFGQCEIVYVGNPYPIYRDDVDGGKGFYVFYPGTLAYEFIPSPSSFGEVGKEWFSLRT
jgi:hypothetical protein